MKTANGYRTWALACVEMAPSLQYRPEQSHRDGYERVVPETREELDVAIRRAALSLRFRAGRVAS